MVSFYFWFSVVFRRINLDVNIHCLVGGRYYILFVKHSICVFYFFLKLLKIDEMHGNICWNMLRLSMMSKCKVLYSRLKFNHPTFYFYIALLPITRCLNLQDFLVCGVRRLKINSFLVRKPNDCFWKKLSILILIKWGRQFGKISDLVGEK